MTRSSISVAGLMLNVLDSVGGLDGSSLLGFALPLQAAEVGFVSFILLCLTAFGHCKGIGKLSIGNVNRAIAGLWSKEIAQAQQQPFVRIDNA
jgi:hypothetical protein